VTNVRWVAHESGWLFPSNGAPAARTADGSVDVGWSRSRALTIEHISETIVAIPFVVLEELVRRGQRWHWRPSSAAMKAMRHK
jgi:hypothetical protein